MTAPELTDLGFTRDNRQDLLETGTIERVHRGVYRSTHFVPTTAGVHLAATRATDGPLVRWSAAFHRGGLRYAPPAVHIGLATTGGVRHRDGVRIARLPSLTADEVQIVDGVPCTTWLRTLLDLADISRTNQDYRWLKRCLRSAAHDEPKLPERLRRHIDEHRPFRGCRILGTLLDQLAPRHGDRRSELEDQFLDLCAEFGLPTPESNQIVHGEEVDKLFRDFGVIVELDTFDHHGDPLAFERDRARDAKLAALGYVVVRITGRRMDHERAAIGRQLLALCRRRAAAA